MLSEKRCPQEHSISYAPSTTSYGPQPFYFIIFLQVIGLYSYHSITKCTNINAKLNNHIITAMNQHKIMYAVSPLLADITFISSPHALLL